MVRCLAEFCLGLAAYEWWRTDSCKKFFSKLWVLPLVLAGYIAGFVGGVDLLVVALTPFLIIGLACDGPFASKVFGNRVVYFLGVISYPIYLFHPLATRWGMHIQEISLQLTGQKLEFLSVIGFALITLVLSIALHYLVELPGRKLVNRIRKAVSAR